MYPRVGEEQGRNRRKTTDWDEILEICSVYFPSLLIPLTINDVFLNIVTRNHLNMNVHVKGICMTRGGKVEVNVIFRKFNVFGG
ncbi:MAG: hypothetical protein WBX81_06965 [Nitrososphaeraceae archaeon]